METNNKSTQENENTETEPKQNITVTDRPLPCYKKSNRGGRKWAWDRQGSGNGKGTCFIGPGWSRWREKPRKSPEQEEPGDGKVNDCRKLI